MRIGFGLALAVLVSAPHTLLQAAEGEARSGRCQNISLAAPQLVRKETMIEAGADYRNFPRSFYPQLTFDISASPRERFNGGNSIVRTSLTFVISVCLDDFEYSIACRERGSLEAAKRLEQIYLDDWAAGRVAGTLNIWFSVPAERGEQLQFLRQVEARAIESVARKLKDNINHLSAPSTNSQEITVDPESAISHAAQQVQKWHDDASMEARNGTNWSHDWGSRTHSYEPGSALHELVRIRNRNREN